MKKVLLLGARGTVGTSLVETLERRGHSLTMADRGLYSAPNYYKCDISHYRQIERIFLEHEFDYVYNLGSAAAGAISLQVDSLFLIRSLW